MSKDEYRKVFKYSDLKVSPWCKFLGISQYRNYQNGRTVEHKMKKLSAKQLVVLSLSWGLK